MKAASKPATLTGPHRSRSEEIPSPPMSNQLTNDNILAALGGVKDPEIGRDLVSLGMVKQITIDGSVVDLTVELTTPRARSRRRSRTTSVMR